MSFPDQQPPQSPYQQPAGDPGTVDLPYYGIGFGAAVKRAFGKYVRFDGRASRSEYWWFYLFNSIVGFILVLLMGIFGGVTSPDGAQTMGGAGIPFAVLFFLYALAALLPSLSVLMRRLHDANLSGWFILLGLIPSVGTLVLIVMAILPSQPQGARFDRAGAGQTPGGY